MKPKHQQGYVILVRRSGGAAVTVARSWFMSLPRYRREKLLKEWEAIEIAK